MALGDRKPPCRDVATWLRRRLGRGCFAPFTGQDWAAFTAWVHLLELYFRADANGQQCALAAMRMVLDSMQSKCWPVCKASIPAIGDWSDEAKLWGLLTPVPHPIRGTASRLLK